jgi:hypothetical protein
MLKELFRKLRAGLDTVVCNFNPSYVGTIGRRITILCQPKAKTQDPVQNITKAKRLVEWLKW